MPPERAGFASSNAPEPHRYRTKEILKAHSEIRQLMGKNPYTFLLIMAVAGLQFALAALMQGQPWWMLLLLAYVVGAVATHALAMMIHECAHNLLFKKSSRNFLAAVVANLPMVVPSAIFFKRYHLKHHAFQGAYALDGDIASIWEANLVGNSALRKTLWLLFLPVFQTIRIWRLKEVGIWDKWLWLNIVAMLGADIAVCVCLGPMSFLYLVCSLFFAVGLHPVGARWIQEHYLVAAPQETYSYYGPLNRVAINVGYHNEHHDFPSVPWHRLPQVRKMAAEWYDSLTYHTSWSKLLVRFIFDPHLSLYSRTLRTNRGGVVFTDEFTPDLELSQEM
ncbi:hypothetical protein NKDENANG_00655 [Candidatus Entotheonellaceae bacterium PAL068K]